MFTLRKFVSNYGKIWYEQIMYQEVLIFFLCGFSESNLANNVHNTKLITI